jgi:hypothetical protein
MADRFRVFTIAEANAMLPRLNVLLERQMTLLRELDERAELLRAVGIAPNDLEPRASDNAAVERIKREMRSRRESFLAGWEEVQATGAVVKDVRLGLIDFCGRLGDDLVWWCWKYGEPAVAFWHPMDKGFADRQPLERSSVPPTLN